MMNVAGRYGRFKLSDRSGKEGDPFVDAPEVPLDIRVLTKYDKSVRRSINDFLNHPLTELFMILLTIMALYITDSNQVKKSPISASTKQRFINQKVSVPNVVNTIFHARRFA